MSLFKASLNEKSENINVEIKVDNLKILTSGIVFSPNGKSIEMELDDIIIKFNFLDDEENSKTRISTKAINDNEVHINLINFGGSSAQGKVIPTPLMYTDNFDIYFSYMIKTLNKKEKHRQMSYTIYYGENK